MPASCAPRARAVFASGESAPKLMSDTKTGMSSHSGFSALGPMHTSVPTGSWSRRGRRASCAVTNWMPSHWGSSSRETPIAPTGPCIPVFVSPFAASSWMYITNGSSGTMCGSRK